ncbi:MAG: hypothetical protein GY841_06545 [FCB group bacterium]|nr:hypothetical protein [FCB group bacterium]
MSFKTYYLKSKVEMIVVSIPPVTLNRQLMQMYEFGIGPFLTRLALARAGEIHLQE